MDQSKLSASVKKCFSDLFRRNLSIKIASLFFAMLFWGYVLTDQNPYRIKAVQNVAVSFEGEADLQARDLVVRGDRSEILKNIVVRVNTRITNYSDLDASDISATVDLRGISVTGEHELPITTYVASSYGVVDSVQPATITVEIDTLVNKTVPVEVQYEGNLPSGYWAGEPELSANQVEIRGAKQDVERVTRAVCYVKRTGRTTSYNDAVNVVLLDEQGEQISPALFRGELASVVVKMNVLPKKTVPIAVEDALLGKDSLPANYELIGATATPAQVEIVGKASVLEGIDSIAMEGINIAGKKASVYQKNKLIVPENVTLLGSDEVEIFVDIREVTTTKRFESVPIQIEQLEDGLTATLSIQHTDVNLEGRVSLMEPIERNDVKAYVDVSGLQEGVYTLDVRLDLDHPSAMLEVTSVLSVARVTVTIERG